MRGAREQGSAIVESAIILPLIALIVFGIVEVGFLFRSATVVNSATRSGARLAAAQYGAASPGNQLATMNNVVATVEKDLESRGSTDTPVQLWIYSADAAGNPPSGGFGACGSPCYVYTWDAGTGHFVYASGSWPSPAACGPVHDSVGVYVKVNHDPIGFASAFGSFTINEKTVMRLEPANTCPGGT